MVATDGPAAAAAAGAAAVSGLSLPNASPAVASSSTTATTPVMSTIGDAAAPLTAGSQGEEQVGPAVARGAFVVLEGLDRSGKTTQVKLLQSRLIEAGRRVQLMRFPGELLLWVTMCGRALGHEGAADGRA